MSTRIRPLLGEYMEGVSQVDQLASNSATFSISS